MILIVISHCYTILPISNSYISSLFDDTGRLGVLFFILISGYFSGKKDIISFKENIQNIFKKLLNFYPFYIVTVIIMSILVYNVSNFRYLIYQFIANIFLIQSFLPYPGGTFFPYSLNTPAWYLSMLLFLWLMDPLLRKIKEKYQLHINKLILIIFFTLFILLIFFDKRCESVSIQRYFMYINPIINVLIYFLGMLCIDKLNNYSISIQISLMILVCTYLLKNNVPVDWRVFMLIFPTLLLISSLVTSIQFDTSIFNRNIIDIGKNSLIMLLTHFPICYVMRLKYPNSNILYFLLTMFLIYMTYYICKYMFLYKKGG